MKTVHDGGRKQMVELSTQKLPVFVKGGSIIPMQSLVQSTSERLTDTLFIHIYKGNVANNFVYYEDDGQSFKYKKGAYYQRIRSYDPTRNNVVLGKVEGLMSSKLHQIKLIFHGFDDASPVKLNGKQLFLNDDFVSFLNPISRFDPQGLSNPVEGQKVKSLIINNDSNKILLSY